MKIYIFFLIKSFLSSILNIFFIMFSLIFILNLISEIDYFEKIKVENYFLIYLTFLNTPNLIFEIFPFIFLIATQFFFLKLFKDNQISIFKYNGLLNSKILSTISIAAFIFGFFIILIFYNFSSNLKKMYLEIKTNYTLDNKYLAVVTKNGLWIKDIFNNEILIINSKKIEKNYLNENFISVFDNNFNNIKNISSYKIDIRDKNWIIYNPIIFENDKKIQLDEINIKTNFDYKKIQNLFSNLSSLSIFKLFELKNNYVELNYSTIDVDIQLLKLISYPFYLLLITLFSGIIMFNSKKFKSSIFKISIGLFFSVIIYYLNNFFNILGSSEKISVVISVFVPLIILSIINMILMREINEK